MKIGRKMEPILTGIIMLIVYALILYAMYKGLNAILGVFALAFLWPLIAGVPLDVLLHEVFEKGIVLTGAGTVEILIGAWFGYILITTGVVETIIRGAAELGGERPTLVAILTSAAVALVFTTVYGAGATVMTGSIAIPILSALGVSGPVAAATFTLAQASGLLMNPILFSIINVAYWKSSLSYSDLYSFFIISTVLTFIVCVIPFNVLKTRRLRRTLTDGGSRESEEVKRMPWYTLISIAIPLLLVIVFKWPPRASFLVGIIYAIISTHIATRRKFSEDVDVLFKSFIKSLPDMSYIILLNMALGVLINGFGQDPVKNSFLAVLGPVIPTTRPLWSTLFTISFIAIPFRGPLGIPGIAPLLLGALEISPLTTTFMFAGFWGTLFTLKSADPTDSQVIWPIAFSKSDPIKHLKTILLFSAIGQIIVAWLAFSFVA